HRGAWPQERAVSDLLVPLGRTGGMPLNGAMSNLAITPHSVTPLNRELGTGGYDVVHVHEPVAPWVGYGALDFRGAPLVGTFHAFSENPVSNGLGNLLAGCPPNAHPLHLRI